MSDVEETARRKLTAQAVKQLCLGRFIEVDHDIPAENDVEHAI
jgi:hypothetical protein